VKFGENHSFVGITSLRSVIPGGVALTEEKPPRSGCFFVFTAAFKRA
jgi:hypothetical protein